MFRLEIDTDNAAFEDLAELPRILARLAACLRDNPMVDGGTLADLNGNTVGRWWED